MRRVKFLVAAGAASLLSSAALAADMPIAPPPQYYAPPPAADFGGWYLRGDIGFSNQSVKNIRKSDEAAYSQVSSLQQTTDFSTAGIYDLGIGYQFNNWFRADITGQYRGNSNFKGSDVFKASAYGTPYDGIDNYTGTKSEWVVMANGYVDLGTWWCITPFVGAGVGMARVNISNFTDNGAVSPYVQGPFPPTVTQGVFPSYATAASGSKWNFAWAAHAGLAYRISPNLTVELAYSYMNLGSGTTGVISDFTGYQAGNTFKFHDITSHDLKLGVRWELNSPPVYAPPLVTKG
jgi:opacity protein-like surface antigen